MAVLYIPVVLGSHFLAIVLFPKARHPSVSSQQWSAARYMIQWFIRAAGTVCTVLTSDLFRCHEKSHGEFDHRHTTDTGLAIW